MAAVLHDSIVCDLITVMMSDRAGVGPFRGSGSRFAQLGVRELLMCIEVERWLRVGLATSSELLR